MEPTHWHVLLEQKKPSIDFVGYAILVGGFNQPIWKKYCSQIGSFPQIGVKIKHIGNHQPESQWSTIVALWSVAGQFIYAAKPWHFRKP